MKYIVTCKHCGRVIKDTQNLNHICKGTMRKSGHKVHIELDLSLGNKNDKKIFKLFSSNEVLLLTAEDISKISKKMDEEARKIIEDSNRKVTKLNDWGTQFPVNEFPDNPYSGFPKTPGNTYLNPCEGCPQYERVKRGETVVCHCTIPYIRRPIIIS